MPLVPLITALKKTYLYTKISSYFYVELKSLILIEPGKNIDEWFAWQWENELPTKKGNEPKWTLAQPEPIAQFQGQSLFEWKGLPESTVLYQTMASQDFNSMVMKLNVADKTYWEELIKSHASQNITDFRVENLNHKPLAVKSAQVLGKGVTHFVVKYFKEQASHGLAPIKKINQAYIDLKLNLRPAPVQSSLGIMVEQGNLTLALAEQGSWLSWTTLTATDDKEDLVNQVTQELTLLQANLQMQGIDWQIQALVIDDFSTLSSRVSSDLEHLVQHLKSQYPKLQTIPLARQPILPNSYPSYQPHFITHFLAQKKRLSIIKHGALAVLLVCGLVVLSVLANTFYLKTKISQTKQQLNIIETKVAPLVEHINEWDTLSPVIDRTQWTLDILLSIYQEASIEGLKLSQVQVQAGAVKIEGQAQSLKIANQFNLRLSKSKFFNQFQWQLPPAKQNSQGQWSFSYQASLAND